MILCVAGTICRTRLLTKTTKFEFPHPFKTMLSILPSPGAKKPKHSLVFPNIFCWLAWGHTLGASRWHVHYWLLVVSSMSNSIVNNVRSTYPTTLDFCRGWNRSTIFQEVYCCPNRDDIQAVWYVNVFKTYIHSLWCVYCTLFKVTREVTRVE